MGHGAPFSRWHHVPCDTCLEFALEWRNFMLVCAEHIWESCGTRWERNPSPDLLGADVRDSRFPHIHDEIIRDIRVWVLGFFITKSAPRLDHAPKQTAGIESRAGLDLLRPVSIDEMQYERNETYFLAPLSILV